MGDMECVLCCMHDMSFAERIATAVGKMGDELLI